MMTQLTEEQIAVVQHQHGPALVFAVAGAGKTTAMVHRIERLVREQVFASHQILASSFSRAAVKDIKRQLNCWSHCHRVQIKTLHGVGYQILQRAKQLGFLAHLQLGESEERDVSKTLYYMMLRQAKRELTQNLDEQDFLSYIGMCKSNLRYACLEQVNLPAHALAICSQAQAPVSLPHYLELYRIFEEIRQEQALVTFDDMLLLSWEALVRFPTLLIDSQNRYQCVLVDEFQDINLAQSEILELLTANHRNYMAIGDDDQTIYQWRGASVDFILNFAARYQARRYLISDNFRSGSVHLALANRVIEHNLNREPKYLSLTRGMVGQTHTLEYADSSQMADEMVKEIKLLLEAGRAPEDIAILLRLYSQTPYIEHFLIENQIPYKVVGNIPFYQRPEVQDLLSYLQITRLEQQRESGHVLSDTDITHYGKWWGRLVNRPTRYLTQEIISKIREMVLLQGLPLTRVLDYMNGNDLSAHQVRRLEELNVIIKWLQASWTVLSAADLLDELQQKLKYCQFLQENSGFPETGDGRAQTVLALVDYARNKGLTSAFLQHLDYISVQKLGRDLDKESGLIQLTTIYRAKGLEWPIVMVPHCNKGTYPYGAPSQWEEERRLFYVALTRPKEQLYLYRHAKTEVSPFLTEARFNETLRATERVKHLIEKSPGQLMVREGLEILRLTPQLQLERYFKRWWQGSTEHLQTLAHFLQGIFQLAKSQNWMGALGLEPEWLEFWEIFGIRNTEPEPFALVALKDCLPKVHSPRIRQASRKTAAPAQTHFFEVGNHIQHPIFGQGIVIEAENRSNEQTLMIRFEHLGEKKIIPRYTCLDLI